MKKTMLVIMLIVLSVSVKAQFPFGNMSSVKVKIKKGIAYVDKVEYIRVAGTDFETDHSYYTFSEEEEFAYTKLVEYSDPNHWDPNSTNPHLVSYWELYFPGVDDYLEIDITLQQFLVAEFYNNQIIGANGSLDTAKVKKYIKKKGKDYTRRREELKDAPQEKVIVIENRTVVPQTQVQPARNRVGVRVGGISVEIGD